jgi:heat shock protein HslJ
MTRKYFLSYLTFFLTSMLLVVSCNSSGSGGGADVADGSWYGVYTGTLPCADCEGIEVLLTLKKDSTFTRILRYMGKDDYLFTEEGTLEWDDESRIVAVAGNDRQIYGFGNDVLFHLDAEGKRIKGDLASMYILDKNIQDAALEDVVWQLHEMNGKIFDPDNEGEDAFLVFKSETAFFSGKNTCNNISGRYKLKKNGGIELSRAATTRMACPDAPYEQEFMALLTKVAGYSFPEEDVMSLQNEEGDTIAEFVLSQRP